MQISRLYYVERIYDDDALDRKKMPQAKILGSPSSKLLYRFILIDSSDNWITENLWERVSTTYAYSASPCIYRRS